MDVVWGAVCRPKQGQTISGDTYVVQDSQDGQLLASVIDGLGGGVEAAEASQQAAVILKRYPYHPLDELIRETHMALRSTRGAVIGVMQVKVYERRMSFIGVGNIGIYVYSDHPIKPISKMVFWAIDFRLCFNSIIATILVILSFFTVMAFRADLGWIRNWIVRFHRKHWQRRFYRIMGRPMTMPPCWCCGAESYRERHES